MPVDTELSRVVEELVEIKRLLMLQLQETHGWSQRDLAAKLGVNQSTISRTLSGRSTTQTGRPSTRKGGPGDGTER